MAKSATYAVLLVSLIASCMAQADLILSGQTVTLSGYKSYGRVSLTKSTINVKPFDGSDKVNSGHLTFNCTSFFMDADSLINARGAGYTTKQCLDGTPLSMGGAGGCSVYDSGGGGGHMGVGGFSTTDCPTPTVAGKTIQNCSFPYNFEQTCHGSISAGGGSCASTTPCRTHDGSNPTIGGLEWHSAYDPLMGMGGSGGDKGCRDGDGFGSNPQVGGFGGGRIRIFVSGKMEVYGTITASGFRACGNGNDSGGGGAGGTVLLQADSLYIRNGTYVAATGGRGGDSQNKDLTKEPECANTQFGGTCDDCGGGGGGGLIYVLVNSGNFSSLMTTAFNASGANGGSCPGCENEAKGIDGFVVWGHTDEVCDGFDNTFDGQIDENQPLLPGCNLPSCVNGEIQECPQPTDPNAPTTQAATTRTSRRTTPTYKPPTTTGTQGGNTGTGGGNTPSDSNGGNNNPSDSNGGNTNNGGTTNTGNGGNTNNGGTTKGTTGGTNGTGAQTTKGTNGSGSAPLEESAGAWVVPSVVACALVAAAL